MPVATKYAIVIPSNKSQASELYLAGQELQLLLEEATGVFAPVIPENALENYIVEHVFSLGETDLFMQSSLSLTPELGDTGYIVKSIEDNLFISGNTDVGTLFGVYGYLEKEFNFDCFAVDCYHVDNNAGWSFSECNIEEIPYVNYRANGNKFILSDKVTMYRMRYTDRDKDNFAVGSASMHTSFIILPKNTYLADNSNWYSNDGTQLCFTAHGNEQDLALMKLTVFEYAKVNLKTNLIGKTFIIGTEDVYSWCECDACKSALNQYGANSGSAIAFCNDIADMIYEWFDSAEGKPYARDGFKVMYSAYNMGLVPPDSIRITCNENVTVCFVPIQMDFLQKISSTYNSTAGKFNYYQYYQGWKEICSTMSYYIYQVNFESPLAFFDTYDFMIDFYRLMSDEEAFYLFDYGHRDTNKSATGFQVYKNYLAYKLSLNAGDFVGNDSGYNEYVDTITDSFFDNYFGPASSSMRSLFDSLSNSKRKKELIFFGGEPVTDYISGKWTNAIYGPSLVYRDLFYDEVGKPYYDKIDDFDTWIGYINKALSDIENLKETDNELYQIYYDRIALERISIYYMAIECAPDRYDNVEEMKITVKEDALRFGITMYDLVTGKDGTIGYVQDLYS